MSLSWRGEQTPNPPEINPRLVFERRLGGDDEAVDAATRANRIAWRKSVLDFAAEDAVRLQKSLNPTDRRKIDECLNSIREVEKRLNTAPDLDVATLIHNRAASPRRTAITPV